MRCSVGRWRIGLAEDWPWLSGRRPRSLTRPRLRCAPRARHTGVGVPLHHHARHRAINAAAQPVLGLITADPGPAGPEADRCADFISAGLAAPLPWPLALPRDAGLCD